MTVTCTLDAVGRASFRTRETVADDAGVAVEAATTLEVPGRALTPAERDEPQSPSSWLTAAQISSRARSIGIAGSSVSARMP